MELMEMTNGDMIQIVIGFVTLLGVLIASYQIRKGVQTERARFFHELYTMFFSDTDIRKAFYEVEYGRFKYDNFHGSEKEKAIDQMLGFFDLICDLFDRGILTKHEMTYFKYEMIRIYKNKEIGKYLDFLRDFYKKQDAEIEPFKAFVSYCNKNMPK